VRAIDTTDIRTMVPLSGHPAHPLIATLISYFLAAVARCRGLSPSYTQKRRQLRPGGNSIARRYDGEIHLAGEGG